MEDNYCLPVRGSDEYFISNWIRDSRRVIKTVIEDVASLPYTQNTKLILQNKLRAQIGQPSLLRITNLTRDEQFLENFNQYPTEILTAMVEVGATSAQLCVLLLLTRPQRYNLLMKRHPFERLIMDLLDKEDTFERTLTVEHVEDKLVRKSALVFCSPPQSISVYIILLIYPEYFPTRQFIHGEINFDEKITDSTVFQINKQVSIFDEEYMMNTAKGSFTPDARPASVVRLLRSFDDGRFADRLHDRMHKTFAVMSHLNRHRRNYRLLREWTKKRPW